MEVDCREAFGLNMVARVDVSVRQVWLSRERCRSDVCTEEDVEQAAPLCGRGGDSGGAERKGRGSGKGRGRGCAG